mgnify:CR=1 FL=1
MKNFFIPEANSAGISANMELNVSWSFTPIAIAIEMRRPMRAYEKSFTNNLMAVALLFSPEFLIAIAISRPPNRPINTQVVLIGTLE